MYYDYPHVFYPVPNQMTSTDSHPSVAPAFFEWPAPSTSRFPLSFERPERQRPRSSTPPPEPPTQSSALSNQTSVAVQTPPVPQSTAYAHLDVPRPPEVAPGVLQDGGLTISFPPVRNFLASSLETPLLHPAPTDKRVFALAALAVFYHPLHPAHWIFWSKDQKKTTAHVVQELLDTKPPPIRSPIGWIAMPENLWILASMQHAYAGALTEVSWYVPPQEHNETRMNLRKRKAQPQPQGESDSELFGEDDVQPPPRKRTRTRRAVAPAETGVAVQTTGPGVSENMGIGVDSNDASTDAVPVQDEKQTSAVLSGPHGADEDGGDILKEDSADAANIDDDQENDIPQIRTSLRQKEKEKRKKTQTDGETSPSGLSATSTLVSTGRDEQSPALSESTPAAPALRARSSSSASLSTRLGSVSSTAVSICGEGGGKKAVVVEVGSMVSEMSEMEDELDGEEEDDQSAIITTRSRSRKPAARKTPATRKPRTAKNDASKVKVKSEAADVKKPSATKSRARAKARPRRR